MKSKELKRLDELRENLDKNSRKIPDYHITSNKDYHIHRKVTTDNLGVKKKSKKKKVPTNVATEKVKTQVRNLFNYGLSLDGRTKISVSADRKQKYETFRFRDEFHLTNLLTEYAKGASLIVFMVDFKNDSIIWSSYGTKEIRIYKQ